MARNRSRKARRTMRLRGAERVIFILGALVYVIGVFGGTNLLSIPLNTSILLLVIGGGMLLFVNLAILF
jgi:hypothetical protein